MLGILRGGIIAAGAGTRLRADGWRESKPLVPVAGKPLIGHALDRFRAAGIQRPAILINEEGDDCRQWLKERGELAGIDLIVRTTASSYDSFCLIAARLGGMPAVITTVDSVMAPDDFLQFLLRAMDFPPDAIVLGLTEHVDDERPLWAHLDGQSGRIRALGGTSGRYVTAGLYVIPGQWSIAPAADFERLRDYLSWLVIMDWPVYGVVVSRVFDIDRQRDIAAAEQALAGTSSFRQAR